MACARSRHSNDLRVSRRCCNIPDPQLQAMERTHLFAIPLVIIAALAGSADRSKRLVPVNQNCNPTTGTCSKGDFVDNDIADCEYDQFLGTCTASGDTGGVISWVVEPDAHDRCKPVGSKPIRCGDPGTNTRCVCSDYKIQFNQCK